MKVRIAGEGDAGAMATGRLRVVRGTKQYGAKRFSVRAGQTKTVKVKLRKSTRRALRSGKALRATLTAKGTDSSGASIAARQEVGAAQGQNRPRRRHRSDGPPPGGPSQAGVAIESGKSYCPLS